VIIGARIRPSFRASNSALWVKKRGKLLIVARTIVLQTVAKEQVAVGIDAANTDGLISVEEVEAEAIA